MVSGYPVYRAVRNRGREGLRSFLVVYALLGQGNAAAQGIGAEPPPGPRAPAGIELATTIERLVPVGARTELVPLTGEPARGEELLYTVTFMNAGGQAATDVRITQPIPAPVRYVPRSAAAPRATVMFSIDGGRSFGWPEELTAADGAGRKVPADPATYTHVRWLLDGAVEPGARGFLRFRAIAR